MIAPLLLAGLLAAPPAAAAPPGFWEHWGDGNAEVSSYDLVQPRYGGLHPGTAVLIFVTEDFSWSERVKADPGVHPDDDVRKVMKLNFARDFQTGIYPYHVLDSTFVRVDEGDRMDALAPIKITFSVQEWCGMVYDELTMGPGTVHLDPHTYFDGDTRPPATMKLPRGVVYGDTVPVLVRGLEGAWLAPGESRTSPWFPAELDQRFEHVGPVVGTATFTRSAAPEPMTVPAGTFAVDRYTVAVAGGPTTTWFVEAADPHRIVGWSTTAGEHAELRGSDRLPYWQLHNPGDVTARARVGL
jgi:hypothetical protein